MKDFLCKICVFLLMFITVCLIPICIFEKKAKSCIDIQPYSNINKVTNMKYVDADLIILGNCRAESSYDASLMSSLSGLKCLNLGWSGSSFDYSYHIMYNTYLKHNKKPRYIILEANPIVFFDHEFPVNSIQLLPYINRPEFQFCIETSPQLTNADKILFVKYFGKIIKVFEEIDRLNHKAKNNSEKNNNGWREHYLSEPQPLQCDKSIVQLFYMFIDECLSEGIKVIVVCSPMHVKGGLSYYDMKTFWSVVLKCVSGTKFPIISYAEYFGDDTTYFSDPTHLNKYGREVFTTKLIHDLDSVGIINAKNQ